MRTPATVGPILALNSSSLPFLFRLRDGGVSEDLMFRSRGMFALHCAGFDGALVYHGRLPHLAPIGRHGAIFRATSTDANQLSHLLVNLLDVFWSTDKAVPPPLRDAVAERASVRREQSSSRIELMRSTLALCGPTSMRDNNSSWLELLGLAMLVHRTAGVHSHWFRCGDFFATSPSTPLYPGLVLAASRTPWSSRLSREKWMMEACTQLHSDGLRARGANLGQWFSWSVVQRRLILFLG